MDQRLALNVNREDIFDNIDAYTCKSKIMIENQAVSLKHKVKDLIRKASHKANRSVFSVGEEPVEDIVKICKGEIENSIGDSLLTFQPGHCCEFGNLIHLEKGLDSFIWKKAKKFDTSMVVEGLCISLDTKSLYIILCNDEESFSCIYKGCDSK